MRIRRANVRITISWNPEMSKLTERKCKLLLACSCSILISLIYVVLTNVLVSSFDFPPTTSSLSSSAHSLIRNLLPCEQPNLQLPQSCTHWVPPVMAVQTSANREAAGQAGQCCTVPHRATEPTVGCRSGQHCTGPHLDWTDCSWHLTASTALYRLA